MAVKFALYYHESVVKDDIPKISAPVRIRIKKTIEEKLATHPEVYGKPLRRSLKGYRKLRVGDYRVIFRIKEKFIKVFIIQHRSVVYKNAHLRINE